MARRSALAGSLVEENAAWRFRYSPALDDDGRPIHATIEQRFRAG